MHRIGRTARLGAEGDAISFACEQLRESLPEIEAFIGHRIPVGSYVPAELGELRPAHFAPRSFGDEEDDGPSPRDLERAPGRAHGGGAGSGPPGGSRRRRRSGPGGGGRR